MPTSSLVRDALFETGRIWPVWPGPVSLDFLRAQARSAYQAYQATRYDATGHILPALIRGVETAARIVGSDSLAACAVRARVYDITSHCLIRLRLP